MATAMSTIARRATSAGGPQERLLIAHRHRQPVGRRQSQRRQLPIGSLAPLLGRVEDEFHPFGALIARPQDQLAPRIGQHVADEDEPARCLGQRRHEPRGDLVVPVGPDGQAEALPRLGDPIEDLPQVAIHVPFCRVQHPTQEPAHVFGEVGFAGMEMADGDRKVLVRQIVPLAAVFVAPWRAGRPISDLREHFARQEFGDRGVDGKLERHGTTVYWPKSRTDGAGIDKPSFFVNFIDSTFPGR